MSAISVEKMGTIDAGRQGENLARTIEFDVSTLLAKWPGAKITLLVKRKGDPEPYFAEAKVEGHILKWPITEVETAVAGDGKIEIQAILGEVIEKSVTATFRVSASLSGSASEELPEVRPSWVDEVLAAAGSGGGSGGAGEGAFIVKTTKDDAGNSIADKTQEEIRAAVAADMVCVLLGSNNSRVYYYCGERTVESDESQGLCPTFVAPVNYVAGEGIIFNQAHVLADGKININGWSPMHTPNPHNLLLWQGKKAKIYNGSELVEVEIPPVNAEPNKFLATDADGNMSWVDRTDVSSEVVILPETVVTDENPNDEDGLMANLSTPLSADVSVGDVCDINYNGTDYECTGVDMSGMNGGVRAVGFGNLAAVSGGEYQGNADAPFVVILIPDGVDFEGTGSLFYGNVIDLTGATTVTLSIVQVGAASDGGSASDKPFIFNITDREEAEDKTGLLTGEIVWDVEIDKAPEEIVAAIREGKRVEGRTPDNTFGAPVILRPAMDLGEKGAAFEGSDVIKWRYILVIDTQSGNNQMCMHQYGE